MVFSQTHGGRNLRYCFTW